MRDGVIQVGRAFYRAHGLGNDYLVFHAVGSGDAGTGDAGKGAGEARPSQAFPLTRQAVTGICRRGEGEGSDGIVVLLDRAPADGVFPLRMFNPDGSEFERSGNGLRVLASYLAREGLVGSSPFHVRSGGEEIPMEVHGVTDGGVHDVSVGLGPARAGEGALPMEPAHLDEEGRAVHPELGPVPFLPVWVGNPHVVVFPEDGDLDRTALLGPFLTAHPAFPRGVNVQLARVEGPGRLRIGIWERGVGSTPASGTSSCAAAVAAVHTGRLPPGRLEVAMAGGTLEVTVSPGLEVVLRGPVAEVATGELTPGFVAGLGKA